MPKLEHHRHEAFAQARAGGALLEDAYEDAGYVPGRGHASRLAARDDVAERISELRAEKALARPLDLQATASLLVTSAHNLMLSSDPRLIREARANLAEAVRLRAIFARQRAEDRQADRDLEKRDEKSRN